jgi:hypothetical protein
VHESHHTYQFSPTRGVRFVPYFGERAAWQQQSDFLRSRGITGTVSQLRIRYPGNYHNAILIDMADNFRELNIENPAVTRE